MRDELDEAALERAARQLNRLRLTKPATPKDRPGWTVDAVLRRGLGPLFSDRAVRHFVRRAVVYYLRAARNGGGDAPR